MANIHTPSEQVLPKTSICVAVTAAATNGASLDTLGFEDVLVVVKSTPSGSGTTVDFKVQDSADDSSFADITGAAFTQITTAGGAKEYVGNVKCSKNRRYVRVVHTGAGGSAAGQSQATLIGLNPRRAPVTQSNTVVFSV